VPAEHPAAATKMLVGLRHAINEGAESQSAKVIGITSPRAKDGKTTLAFNLAWFMAQGRCRVLLIDANLRNPCLARELSPRRLRIRRCEDEQRAIDKSVIPLNEYGFDLYENQQSLAGAYPPTSLDFSAMKRLLEKSREAYDYVIVDLPSILDDIDTSSCADLLDGVLMLVRFGRTTKDEVVDALGELALVQDRVLGAVGNVERMPGRNRQGR
jgi:succinoglycan biosynthesis transport protein ExoP